MKLAKRLLILLIAVIAIQAVGCHQDENSSEPLIQKVFVVNIVPNEQKLKEYLSYHAHVWPEVAAGFRKAGYKKITLYRYRYLVVMVVTVPKNADLASMGKVAESYSPKCAAWNKLMAGYQTGVPGTDAGTTWVETKPYYQFENN